MKFAIFTHVEHKVREGQFYAYSPYVREMNLWFKYVQEVEVIAPAPQATNGVQNTEMSYQHTNIKFTKIPYFNFLSLTDILKSVLKIPYILFKILKAMSRADHLHLRCPGNVGLLACICQIFFPKKIKSAKYAGNWDPRAKQPWTYKLQKLILNNTFLTRNIQVLVYGDWPIPTKNILPFFTASFSESEIEKNLKDFNPPYKFLFVGNLVAGKQPLLAVGLIKALRQKNINAELHFYGDGNLKNELEIQAENKDYIHLHGNQPLDVVKKAYKESHFIILASKSEGWPKAVAEAMFFGCIPVVTGVSCVPWMLGNGSRGILMSVKENRIEKREKRNKVERGERRVDSRDVFGGVESGEWKEDSRNGLGKVVRGQRTVVRGGVVDETADRIIELIKDPEEMKRMSMEAQEWSQPYTLERFEGEIKKLLVPKGERP